MKAHEDTVAKAKSLKWKIEYAMISLAKKLKNIEFAKTSYK